MPRWNRSAWITVLTLLIVGLSLQPSLGQPNLKGDLKTVTYTELGQLVRGLKGKVVVVYFWADY